MLHCGLPSFKDLEILAWLQRSASIQFCVFLHDFQLFSSPMGNRRAFPLHANLRKLASTEYLSCCILPYMKWLLIPALLDWTKLGLNKRARRVPGRRQWRLGQAYNETARRITAGCLSQRDTLECAYPSASSLTFWTARRFNSCVCRRLNTDWICRSRSISLSTSSSFRESRIRSLEEGT